MKKVVLKPLHHRGQECIGIYFEINFKIQEALKKRGWLNSALQTNAGIFL
ncbi:MAG: hypothetical protein ACHQEB_00450 [Chitinophagales bacterium]